MFLGFPRAWTVQGFKAVYSPTSPFVSYFIFIIATAFCCTCLLQDGMAAGPLHPNGASPAGGPTVTISISPTSASVVSLATVQFTATVTNSTDTSVTWKKTGNGSISTTGLFTAPWVTAVSTTTITATSKADKTKFATATVTTSPIPALSITTPSLPNTTTGAPYSQTLAATGGTPPYSWQVTVGSLPTGIALDSTGILSGSTTQTGAFTFTARVDDSGKYQKNAHQTYTFNVNLSQSGSPIPASFFNMHMDLMNTPWPSSPVAGQRLWDAGVTWALINTAAQEYDWSILDGKLADAQTHSADVLYTLSSTPSWAQCGLATSSPCVQIPGCEKDTTSYGGGPGQCYWPGDLNADGTGTNQHWKDWITAIAAHSVNSNTAHIKYYEIMNEPNIDTFWRGTTAQAVRMAKDAACIIKGVGQDCTNIAIDPAATILSPSPSSGGIAINAWMSDFFKQGGGQYIDIIAFHGYNGPNAEKVPSMVSALRNGAQTTYGFLSKPLIDSEFSWGLHADFPDPDQRAGFVARSILLHWSSGVSRIFWYGWDVSGVMWSADSIPGCTAPDASGSGFTCTPALALTQVESWVVGMTQTQACSATGTIWMCTYTRSGGVQALAVWDTAQTCSAGSCTTSTYTFSPTTPNFSHYWDLKGKSHAISGKTVPIGYKPIFLVNQ